MLLLLIGLSLRLWAYFFCAFFVRVCKCTNTETVVKAPPNRLVRHRHTPTHTFAAHRIRCCRNFIQTVLGDASSPHGWFKIAHTHQRQRPNGTQCRQMRTPPGWRTPGALRWWCLERVLNRDGCDEIGSKYSRHLQTMFTATRFKVKRNFEIGSKRKYGRRDVRPSRSCHISDVIAWLRTSACMG